METCTLPKTLFWLKSTCALRGTKTITRNRVPLLHLTFTKSLTGSTKDHEISSGTMYGDLRRAILAGEPEQSSGTSKP